MKPALEPQKGGGGIPRRTEKRAFHADFGRKWQKEVFCPHTSYAPRTKKQYGPVNRDFEENGIM
jgi:hypothetical protein